jgi:hypothetical protein
MYVIEYVMSPFIKSAIKIIFWCFKYLFIKFTWSSSMLCVHTKFSIYYVLLVFMKSKYVPKIKMSQDIPNSKTILSLISALKFNLYKCGKW